MRKALYLIILLLFTSNLASTRTIEEIKRSGVIYAAFTESSLNSVNYQIALEFAKFLDVKLVPIITTWNENLSHNGKIPSDIKENPNISYTPDALKKADFICGTIYIYEWRKKLFDFAGIIQVSDLLVVRKNQQDFNFFLRLIIPSKYLDNISYSDIRTLKDLENSSIALMKNTSYEVNISLINSKLGNKIDIVKTASEEESQQLLLQNKVDGLVTVSMLALQFINQNPNAVKLAFPVGKAVDVGWAVEKNNDGLTDEINNFFETIEGNGTLNDIFQKSYGIDYKTYLDIINSYSDASETQLRTYDDILKSGKIVVGLRQREMIYLSSGKKQFSQYMAEEFARFLNLQLEIKEIDNISDIFTASNSKIYSDSCYTPEMFKSVDLVCDILAPVPWRLSKVDIINYLPNALVVVGRKDLKITTVADLKKFKGITEKGSSYENALINNKITNYDYALTGDMLGLVDKGKYDYTIVSIDIYKLSEYQNLEPKFILGEIEFAGWAIKKNDPKLKQKILEFFDYTKKSGILDYYFKQQTGMPFKASEKFLIALHQTYNIGSFPFVFYGSEAGLPQENIMSIFQDNQSYIWFSTFSGAVRFNGRRMDVFNVDNGLIGNEVFDIEQDKNNILYFATLKGVSTMFNGKIDTLIKNIQFKQIYIDSKNNKFFFGDAGIVLYTNKKELIYLNNQAHLNLYDVHSIVEIPSTNQYFVAGSTGLYILDLQRNSLLKITGNFINCVYIDIDENVWISSNEGIYYNDLNSVLNKHIGEPINKKINVNVPIRRIEQTKDDAVWLVGDYEAYQLFSINLSTIVYDQTIGLSGQRILSFFVDNEDNIWFGYDGGVQKLTNKSLRIIYPDKLNNSVNNILQDEQNNYWFSFNNKLFYLSDSLQNLTSKFAERLTSFVISKNSKNNIIVSTNEAIYEVDPKDFKNITKNIFDKKLSYVKNIFIDSRDRIFISTGISGGIYYLESISSRPKFFENPSINLVYDFAEINGFTYACTNSGIVKFTGDDFESFIKTNYDIYTIKQVDSNVYVGTGEGLFTLQNGNLRNLNIRNLSSKSITAICSANSKNYLWLGTYRGLNYVNLSNQNTELYIDKKDGLPGNEVTVDGIFVDVKGLLWIGTVHGIATFDIKKLSSTKYAPDCSIETISLNGKKIDTLPKTLKHFENNIVFELSGLSFKNEEAIVYDYYLRGKNRIFESSSQVPYVAAYQNLPPGKYNFLYRAKGKDGIWSYNKSVEFEILKPLWLRWGFIIFEVVVFLLIIYLIVRLREKALKARNEELERMVEERTQEIQRQKSDIEAKNAELEQQQEEIIAQRDEITRQRDIAEEARDEISHQKEEIMDSIYYAKKIQSAILPPKEALKSIIPEHFILYLPRDVVSGDFYWIKKINNFIIVATGDCTGHGVPGAFMSMLGATLLNEIVHRSLENLVAGLVLDELRDSVVNSLHQTGKIEETKDGMDMSFYIIDIENHKIQFAGAFNSMLIVRGEEMIELKADRMPIGIYEKDKETPFKTQYFEPQNGDLFYTYSDGYASQFGGPNGKKFKQSRFEKLLLTIKDKNIDEQKSTLDITLKNWTGVKYAQVDDIVVIGVKYTWK